MELAQRSTRLVWLFLILISLLTACSRDCFVADSYEEIHESKLNNIHLFLYIKTTGFNEKQQSFQLYSVRPVFDDCGMPSVEPVAEEYIDVSAGYVEKLMIKNGRITVIYSKTMKSSLKKIPVDLE